MTTPKALVIPDSLLAREATAILRENSTDLLFSHLIRVYLSAAEQGRQRKLRFDPELLYVAAAFHDLGLIKKFLEPGSALKPATTYAPSTQPSANVSSWGSGAQRVRLDPRISVPGFPITKLTTK